MPRPMSCATLAALLLATGCVPSMRIEHGGGPAPRPADVPPPQARSDRTDMLLWSGARLPAGKNVLWSAGAQMAWDMLADQLGKDGRLDLDPPAPADVVAGLNRGRFPLADLDPDSYVVAAGFAKERVYERFAEGMKRMGASFPLDLPDLAPEDVAALAYIRKDMPFRQPFHVHPTRISFAGGPQRVVAFGLDPEDHGADVSTMRSQTRLHAPPDAATTAGAGVRLALELLPKDANDRIVLAAMPPPATLEAGWALASQWLSIPGTPVTADVKLEIPKVDFAADRDFDEIAGAHLSRWPPDAKVKEAKQRIEFTLSEKGARFVSATVMVASCSAPPRIRRISFDQPFLLALMRKGASRPYFLAWFENDDLFVKS